MKLSKTKVILLAGAALTGISGAIVWNTVTPFGDTANKHGEDYVHEAGEKPHVTEKEEHGHAHEEHKDDDHSKGEHGSEEEEHAEGVITLSAEQIAAADIKADIPGPGTLAREVNVPGKIITAADRMAQIVPKVGGTVTYAKKNLGDTVKKGEILALIESREMAEAVADYRAAKRNEELARTTFIREKSLWQKKITAKQDYLNAQNIYQTAQITLDLTRQKLQALGRDVKMLKSDVSAEAADKLRFHELRSPLEGRVIGRELTLGEYVDTSGPAFTVADLSLVWVETAIAPADLPFVTEGRSANIIGGGDKSEGKLIFVSPAIDPETQAAKAVIALENKSGKWRPGEFVNVAVVTSVQDVAMIIPKEALQTIERKPVVFVRTDTGFVKRDVVIGREDSRRVEIISGITKGETVAMSGTFTLKAELGKSEAEHEH